MKPIISVDHLTKSFQVEQKEPGLSGSIRSLFHRKYTEVHAVQDVTFSIDEGELLGFIGPNGAGKTTTLKMLSGLLYPTSGKVRVLGFDPFERKPEYLRQISLVMGQKNQLWWDLPAMDTFLLNKEIYQVEPKQFSVILNDLVSLLDVSSVLTVPVRKLSLGQRMKMELIAALLHSPKILYLDEPTIGLDVVMQVALRDFIREYNQKFAATIILTSHYMDDVKSLCKRVIIIDHGRLMFDGSLESLVSKFAPDKYITVTLDTPLPVSKLQKIGKIVSYADQKAIFSVERSKATGFAATLLHDLPVVDVNIEEPKIEDIIRDVFSAGTV